MGDAADDAVVAFPADDDAYSAAFPPATATEWAGHRRGRGARVDIRRGGDGDVELLLLGQVSDRNAAEIARALTTRRKIDDFWLEGVHLQSAAALEGLVRGQEPGFVYASGVAVGHAMYFGEDQTVPALVGAVALVSALVRIPGTKLKEVCIDDCDLTDECLTALAAHIRSGAWPNLIKFSVSDGTFVATFTTRGVEALIEALGVGAPALFQLDVRGRSAVYDRPSPALTKFVATRRVVFNMPRMTEVVGTWHDVRDVHVEQMRERNAEHPERQRQDRDARDVVYLLLCDARRIAPTRSLAGSAFARLGDCGVARKVLRVVITGIWA